MRIDCLKRAIWRSPSPFYLSVIAIALAGCSTSLAPNGLTTASLPSRPAEGTSPIPNAQPAQRYQWNGNPQRIQTGALAPAPQTAPAAQPSMVWKATPQAPLQPAAVAPKPVSQVAAKPNLQPTSAKPSVPANEIIVAPGDTLYSLAKQHRVPVMGLMAANNLTEPVIKPNQHLMLPVSRR